jgi:hypothetical protein
MKSGFTARNLGLQLISYGSPNGHKYYNQGSQMISLSAGALDPANRAVTWFFTGKDLLSSLKFEVETLQAVTFASVSKFQQVIIATEKTLLIMQRAEQTFVYSKQIFFLSKMSTEFSNLYGALISIGLDAWEASNG